MNDTHAPTAVNTSAQSSPPTGTGGAEWQHHEHVAELTHGQAQQLIESAGSPELAKHAIEVVVQQSAEQQSAGVVPSERESQPDAQAALARLLGYASYLDLYESSKLAAEDRDRRWLVTAVKDGSWVLWNDAEFQIAERFDSQQAALAAAAPIRRPR